MNELPLFEDDLADEGLIDPVVMHQRHAGSIAPVAVLCFFNDLISTLVEADLLTYRHTLRSEIGNNPIYELSTPTGPVTVVHPGVGAPLAAAFVEELRGLGVTTMVACGGAGALRPELDLGHVMVVGSALRDEGTSFHYAAPSRILDADPLGVEILSAVLREHDVPFHVGRAWTTDGLFRETKARIARREAEGCSLVDMEASAFIAVAKYRQLRFAQLLYAGDSVAGDEWDSRHWDKAVPVRRRLFELAATAALRLHIA